MWEVTEAVKGWTVLKATRNFDQEDPNDDSSSVGRDCNFSSFWCLEGYCN